MNRNIFHSIILIILFLSFLFSPFTQAHVNNTDIYPITNGSSLYVGGSGLGNFSKIQDAINNSSNGDTVFVYDDSSPYYENVILNKSIRLIGENRHTTIIDGMGIDNVIWISVDFVNISRFTITNCSKGSSAGIRGSTNYSTISKNNIVSNNWSGLGLKFSHFNTISDNKINSNRWLGMWFSTCNNNIVSRNKFISNIHEGFVQFNSNNNTISGNIVSKNEVGFLFGRYCENNTISGNIIIKNEYGIRFHETYGNNTIRNNCIRWNMYGISMEYSYLNKIVNNNFVSNAFCAHFDSYYLHENRTNYWKGNFWKRPRLLPKMIVGTLWTYGSFQREFDLEFDRNPALIPNRIGG
jgi:parallel beta-helix repeat protein